MEKKNSKTDVEDYEIKFWKDWLEADGLKRMKLVEKLPITNEVFKMDKMPPKMRHRIFASMLNSFFEDLESAVYTKIRLEKKK